jgi:hypothetical protein
MFTPERNPFEVLRLDPMASEDAIVRQADRLRRRAGDEIALAELRRAVRALTGPSEERQLLALFTHPRPSHAADVLDRLAATYRRAPVPVAGIESAPVFDYAEFAELIGDRLAEAIGSPQLPFEPLMAGDDSTEIARQTDEVLWQALMIDNPG